MIVKHLFKLKTFFHSANLIQIKTGILVQKDPKAVPTKGLTALYTAKASDFSIVIAKGLKGSSDKRTVNIFESKDGDVLTVIDFTRYVKTKEFVSGKYNFNL